MLRTLQESEIAQKKLAVGFDGFIDTIARPLRVSDEQIPFTTIREFGEYLCTKAEKSCSIELQIQAQQLGGNLPYLSQAAGKLGLSVTCIGMLGEAGSIAPPFAQMPCKMYSFAPAAQSTCLEFHDGKVLLSPTCTVPDTPWTLVQQATENKAADIFAQADIFALVNWSELTFAGELWEKVYTQAIASAACDKTRFAFFDLCDCSRKPAQELESVLTLIGKFAQYRTAVLSLNENEAFIIGAHLSKSSTDIEQIAQQIRQSYGIDEVLIHTIRQSLLASPRGLTTHTTDFVTHPVISTGAGDHFNAASCFGAVMHLTDKERLHFADCFASFYVASGHTPSFAEMLNQ